VVAVAVVDEDRRRALDGVAAPTGREHRVPLDPRIDEQDLAADLDAEGCVAKPGDLQVGSP
jgi:hypothetical protein